MAYGYWPDLTPGSQFGPCLTPCKHKDCAYHRDPANSTCIGCNKIMKTDERFYLQDGKPIHAHELEDA